MQPCELQVGSTSQQCNGASCKLAASSRRRIETASSSAGCTARPARAVLQGLCSAAHAFHPQPPCAGWQSGQQVIRGRVPAPSTQPAQSSLVRVGRTFHHLLVQRAGQVVHGQVQLLQPLQLAQVGGEGAGQVLRNTGKQGRSSASIRECRLPRLAGKGWVRCCSRALTQKQGSELRS